MGQMKEMSSLRPDHTGTFTKGEIEKAREEDEIEDKQPVVKLKNFSNYIV